MTNEKQLTPFPTNLTVTDRIADVTYENDVHIHRVFITFTNGYSISVIQGQYSYGGRDGLFEVVPFDKNNVMDGRLLGITYDDVIGYLTAEKVAEHMRTVSEL